MKLGCFSVSLTVKDIAKSLAFYQTLGFEQIDGKLAENWIILQNGEAKIGLFHGMFDNNLMTFNPDDARAIEKVLDDAGCDLVTRTEGSDGPAHFVVEDPDGNLLLVDQHV